jgi:hypothetical protein
MAIQTPIQVPGSPPPPTPPTTPPTGDGWSGATPGAPIAPPPRPRRRIAKKWWWAAGIGVVAIIAVAVSAKPAPTDNTHPAPTVVPTAAASAAAPTPAATSAPTAAPTAPPIAIPALPSVTLIGRGDSVVKVPPQYNGQAALVTAKNSGGTNFSVWTLGAGNTQQQLLVNTIGNFTGVEAMNFDGSSPAGSLQIGDSGGRWSITFSDPATAPAFATSTSGSDDAVVAYTGGAGTAAFTNRGQGNFAVLQFAATGSSENLLVNVIGNYTGSVPTDPGFLVITSDGKWTVSVSH